MHWVIQNNIFYENGIEKLIELIQRFDCPHDLVKIIPFVGELDQDINPQGPVICIGSYSMRHLAKRKGWTPGVFDLGDITYQDCINHWGVWMLNYGARVCRLHTALSWFDSVAKDGLVFIRPIHDSKFFAGGVMDFEELLYMVKGVQSLGGEADPSGLTMNTEVMMSEPKNIRAEYRFWIVNGQVVTGSLYKRGGRVVYSDVIDKDVETFAHACVTPMSVHSWNPLRAFVLDVAHMEDESMRIVELNTLNAAGLYAADVNKLFGALNSFR